VVASLTIGFPNAPHIIRRLRLIAGEALNDAVLKRRVASEGVGQLVVVAELADCEPGVYQRRTNPYTGDTLAAGAYGLDRWKGGASGCTFTRSGVTLTLTAGTLVQLVEGACGPFSVGDNWGQMTLSWSARPKPALTAVLTARRHRL
jgi:hypothetical protein